MKMLMDPRRACKAAPGAQRSFQTTHVVRERQRDGIAKAEGIYKGRKPTARAKATLAQ